MTNRVLAFALGIVALCSCDAPTDQSKTDSAVCTAEARPGLVLSVIDSTTGQPIASPSIVAARAGLYADTARIFVAPTYYFLYERAGTYIVTVTHSGFQPWRRDGVIVVADRCHVQTVRMTAALHP
jgi:hypothetical protein